ncbi:arsenate reductase [Acinetobacter baumannii CI86]|nr:arsenate reductase [Acinetobacter baumannii OIFC143]EJP52639.1 arsenate reductase [Acinetobacter baumannii Naval-18]EKP55585.1 arsenate reductase [Acinetobacter baumannii Naval-82]ETQ98064.1 arsenate reductase [Acinetobacter baumannii UH6507]ETR86876.1 arsenate reductase [Acinetobacter baumannii CI86]EXH48690.1 arsenate reductase [Acinetobacter baumannii 1412924]KMV28217.1 arsenate reductase [Acinetobacter baumannii]
MALIRHAGIEPIVIEYLQTPPSKDELIQLIKDSNLSVREAIRKNVEPYKDLELEQDHWTDEQLIDFMVQYPILINRPFVVTPKGTRLCRPSEMVLDILDSQNLGYFAKEDGEVIIDEQGRRLK